MFDYNVFRCKVFCEEMSLIMSPTKNINAVQRLGSFTLMFVSCNVIIILLHTKPSTT